MRLLLKNMRNRRFLICYSCSFPQAILTALRSSSCKQRAAPKAVPIQFVGCVGGVFVVSLGSSVRHTQRRLHAAQPTRCVKVALRQSANLILYHLSEERSWSLQILPSDAFVFLWCLNPLGFSTTNSRRGHSWPYSHIPKVHTKLSKYIISNRCSNKLTKY